MSHASDDDSFYNNSADFEDDSGIKRSRPLSIAFLSAPGIEGSADRKNAGIIVKDPNSPERKGGPVADCFKPETKGIHKNKGGDGFEAWKGSRRVIKKLKLGVQIKE